METVEIFSKYPEFQFDKVETYISYIKIGEKETYKSLDNILRCKTLSGESYLYIKDINKLYKIICNSWLTCLIIQDVTNLKYNLFNVLTGNLRFDISNQADTFIINKKMHDFIINNKKYSGLNLYNFTEPLV